MINFFALTAEGAEMSWGERASTAGTVTLMGMVTVFIVLTLLWGTIELMHLLLHKGDKKAKTDSAVSDTEGTSASAATDSAETVADDGVTIAVITAAVSAYMEAEGQGGAFRVVSFKRVGKTSRKQI